MSTIADDSWMFETFRILDKYKRYPKGITNSEKKRLKELGIKT